jgi:ATP-dependent DNA helicase DinG
LKDLRALFSADGPLAREIAGFKVREQQIEMAEAVEDAIEHHRVLIAEAGTGTGKTFAYLAPALISGGKVIISTGTKTLQDQLFHRDLPTVRRALNLPVTVALLKGRANYVCHYHLERTRKEGRLAHREDVRDLQRIVRFAKITRSGDKAELADVPEGAPVWNLVSSTRENCLGQKCEHYSDCFVMLARREALAADVVVVNHHLFFADVVLRDEGMSELLPACNTVILDEAHQLPDTATLFFGEEVSTAQILELVRDATVELLSNAPELTEPVEAARALEKAARDLRLAVGGGTASAGSGANGGAAGGAQGGREATRLSLAAMRDNAEFWTAVAELQARISRLASLLEFQAERAEGIANCWLRAAEISSRLKRWAAPEDAENVRWVEVFNQALQLHATPLSVAGIFRKQLEGHPRAWILTSATLAVQGNFTHYQTEMGLTEAVTRCWDSPFDYANQALLYLPQQLPEPGASGHTEAVIEAAMPVLRASGGRAFLLFTTLRAMQRAQGFLAARFADENLDYPILTQGEGSRSELLERFRRLGNAVLIASQSFWEGVDVRGEALSVVVIDKLPFAPPDDPVIAARIENLAKTGHNAFMEYQLPQAVISLKQGAGRLIRDETDRGVLMICDPRLVSKAYGKRIWQSLPPMRRTRESSDAVAFFGSEAALKSSAPSFT